MRQNRTEQFQRALSRMLRPIARAMIAHGVTLSAATEALKRALFDAAADLSVDEPKLTDSRISLMTGLHRKDVRRLREETEPPARRSLVNACTLVISYWTVTDRFTDKDGNPKALLRTGSKKKAGFDDLVQDARIDLPAATVLDALVKEGAVNLEQRNTIRLVQDAFIADPDSEAMISAYEKNLLAHLQSATENLLATDKDARNFERATHFSHLSDESVEELVNLARERSEAVLKELNRRAMALQQRDAEKSDQRGRFSLGTYIFGKNDKQKSRKDGD
ncbi:MAG: hypothetical protein GY789_13050 [Hyphomicrobiales bacterium]|nr:hypothetical protein [Hyphomicrobiales bacterium]MCP5002179.1 hypothetical protein [Hyphomicrobiales bacterium]